MISAEGLGYTFVANDLASGPITRLNANVKGLATTSTAAQVAYNRNMTLIKQGTKQLLIGGIGLMAVNSLTKSYGKFEMALASAGAVMNATAGEMANLEKAAIQAGIATQFDPREAAQGLENLGAAGMNAKQAIATLNPVLDLAAASLGQLGVAESAANVAGVLNAFGDSTERAAERVDQLVRITQMSNFQARDFSIAISQAAAQAASADQTFESMTATLGMLRNTNLDASSSATAYREAVRRLASDKRSLKKLTELGIDTVDRETGKIKDLGKIMAELIPRAEQLGAQEKNLALKRIFGVRGMKTYNAFFMAYKKAMREGTAEVGDFAAVHNRLVEGLEQAGGTAERTREKLLATSEGQRILLKGSIETLKVTAGKALVPAALPALKAMITTANAMIKVFSKIPAGMRGFLAHFVGVGAALMAFTGLIKVIIGIKGLMGLSAAAGTAAKATETLTMAQARQNVILAKGQGLRARAAAQMGMMRAAASGIGRSLPIIGVVVASLAGLFSMMREREAKERKRIQQVRENQRRMRAEYLKTREMVESIGKAAAKSGAKLIKMSKLKDLVEAQRRFREAMAKESAASMQLQRNFQRLREGNLTKSEKQELKAQNKKLIRERDGARKVAEVNKHVELQIRANRLKRIPYVKRTEEQNRTIVTANQARIIEMKRREAKLQKDMDKAREFGQKETVKQQAKALNKMRRQRERLTAKTGYIAGFRGGDVKARRRVIGEFAAPRARQLRQTGDITKVTGLPQGTIDQIRRGTANIDRYRGVLQPWQLRALEQDIAQFDEATGGEYRTARKTVGIPKLRTSKGQGGGSVLSELASDIGLEKTHTSLEAAVTRAIKEGMRQARIQIAIDGENVPSENKNRSERTAQGRPAQPAS